MQAIGLTFCTSVSSTFGDLKPERNGLQKGVLPCATQKVHPF
jgi:hypothetical protein